MGISDRGREGDIKSYYEALKESSSKNCCPFLKTCSVKLTRDYFLRVCNTNVYVNCHHLAKRIGELKTPVGWLQKIAVESDAKAQKRSQV